MRLLLDEMLSPDIADQLRRRGHDVLAVAERPDLRAESDDAIFACAQAQRQVLVTENTGDFGQIAAAEIDAGRSHVGLILTTNRSFSRHDPRVIGRIVVALEALLRKDPDLTKRDLWLS